MPQWRLRVKLKDLLSDDVSDEAVRSAAANVVARLRELPESKSDLELAEIIDEFDEVATASSPDGSVLGGRFTLCDWFNNVMDDLYDWADAERVWID